jgi:hypothetical protein
MAVLVTVFAVVVALLAVLVAGLLRSHAEILRSLHELGVDLDPDSDSQPSFAAPVAVTNRTSVAPRSDASPRPVTDISGVTPTGDAASIAVNGARHHTLLAFLTSGCSTCADFWSEFADTRLKVPGDARLVVVTKGSEAESPGRLRKFTPPDVPVVMSSEAWDAYDVPVAPYFVFVDGPNSRIVGEGAAATWRNLSGMMEQAVEDAGLDTGRRRRRRGGDDSRSREAEVDRALLAAGIEPGHPSLYPTSDADLHEGERS